MNSVYSQWLCYTVRLHPHPSTILFRQNIFLCEQRTSDGSSPAVQSAILSTACFGNTSILAEAACESSDLIYSVERGFLHSMVNPSVQSRTKAYQARAARLHSLTVVPKVGTAVSKLVWGLGDCWWYYLMEHCPSSLFTISPFHPPPLAPSHPPTASNAPARCRLVGRFPRVYRRQAGRWYCGDKVILLLFLNSCIEPVCTGCSCVVQSAECRVQSAVGCPLLCSAAVLSGVC